MNATSPDPAVLEYERSFPLWVELYEVAPPILPTLDDCGIYSSVAYF